VPFGPASCRAFFLGAGSALSYARALASRPYGCRTARRLSPAYLSIRMGHTIGEIILL
jgi:hypothetical protein